MPGAPPATAGHTSRLSLAPLHLHSELPAGPFDLFMADPAWAFAVRSPKGAKKSASQHYATMSLDEIKALPVAACAARGPSVLLLWAIDPMIPQALEVMAAWGFTFKTVGFYWAKTTQDGKGFPIGTGYYTRANPELCLLGTRGGTLPRADKGVRKLIVSPRREHSRKPDEAYAAAERLFGYVRRLDLFARQERPGWTAWGLETNRFPMPMGRVCFDSDPQAERAVHGRGRVHMPATHLPSRVEGHW